MASKWFTSKSFKLSLPRHHRRSDTHGPPISRSPPYDNSRAHQLREAFRYFDSNGDGKISSEELISFFAGMGENISQDEADAVIGDHDTDGDRLLDFQDFVQLLERDSGDDDLRRAFEMFEIEKGSGCITPNGLQRMLDRLGDHKTYDECVAMIRAFDLDGNGVLDFNEFQTMMT
ncbi:probable calcium-binding protein CML41 [Magnolia sinica]|uniref:probable calcium-binding protein CML41 n=1 Tax=Magnolia sinica TaxID=86752 RepID=UPI00265A0B1E|nr:probable calcium-binding protein CML41 [Magnolia sinica]